MRKGRCFSIGVLSVVLLLGLAPFVSGWFVKERYQETIAYYNTVLPVRITLESYQQGWMNSTALLSVDVPLSFLGYVDSLFLREYWPKKMHFTVLQTVPSFSFSNALVFPEWKLMEEDLVFLLSGLKVHFFSEGVEIMIHQLSLNQIQVGPFHLKFIAKNLNHEALFNMLAAYQKIKREGEVYRLQLQNKLLALLPEMIQPGVRFYVQPVSLKTELGSVLLKGDMQWPLKHLRAPEDIADFFERADVTFFLVFSKKLLDEVIGFVSTTPYFHDFSFKEREELLQLESQIEFAYWENSLFLMGLVEEQVLSEEEAGRLFFYLKEDEWTMNYLEQVKEWFFARRISRELAYALYYQLALFKQQVALADAKINVYQWGMRQTLFSRVYQAIKDGYLIEKKENYVIDYRRQQGKIKVNGVKK